MGLIVLDDAPLRYRFVVFRCAPAREGFQEMLVKNHSLKLNY
jgi:hypothetical protein